MNLSPEWVPVLESFGWTVSHWSTTGDPRARDRIILEWAREHGFVLFTHDLDFGAILAASRASAPSVLQVRTQDVTPSYLTPLVVAAVRQHESELRAGALVSLDELTLRVRLLPLT